METKTVDEIRVIRTEYLDLLFAAVHVYSRPPQAWPSLSITIEMDRNPEQTQLAADEKAAGVVFAESWSKSQNYCRP